MGAYWMQRLVTASLVSVCSCLWQCVSAAMNWPHLMDGRKCEANKQPRLAVKPDSKMQMQDLKGRFSPLQRLTLCIYPCAFRKPTKTPAHTGAWAVGCV